ncbi:MAG: VF530 family protein [Bacteroidota bacterium]
MEIKKVDNKQDNNPLHGVKLADILEYLVAVYWWDELSERINIRCFKVNPSIKSCLKFLRRTPWAREKVEELYLRTKK